MIPLMSLIGGGDQERVMLLGVLAMTVKLSGELSGTVNESVNRY